MEPCVAYILVVSYTTLTYKRGRLGVSRKRHLSEKRLIKAIILEDESTLQMGKNESKTLSQTSTARGVNCCGVVYLFRK